MNICLNGLHVSELRHSLSLCRFAVLEYILGIFGTELGILQVLPVNLFNLLEATYVVSLLLTLTNCLESHDLFVLSVKSTDSTSGSN